MKIISFLRILNISFDIYLDLFRTIIAKWQLQKIYLEDFIFWLFRCVRRSSLGGDKPESLRFCEENCPRRNGICQRSGQGYRLGKHFFIFKYNLML